MAPSGGEGWYSTPLGAQDCTRHTQNCLGIIWANVYNHAKLILCSNDRCMFLLANDIFRNWNTQPAAQIEHVEMSSCARVLSAGNQMKIKLN